MAASLLALATVANAQNARTTSTTVNLAKEASLISNNLLAARTAAVGDTVFFYNIEKSPKISPTAVQPGFGLVVGTVNKAAMNAGSIKSTPGFGFFQVVRAPGDTNVFALASSYYASPAAANNYLGFGALKMPVNGATFSWKHTYFDKDFRDGYVVYASNVKPDSANNYAASTRVTLKTIMDNDTTAANSTKGDTTSNFKKWYKKSVVIPATFNNAITYLFVNHNANDMNGLALDEFLVVENGTVGVKSVTTTTTTSTLYPNPATSFITLGNVEAGAVVNVYNTLGAVVLTEQVSATNHTINIANLANGNYIVRVGNTTPVRFTVAK